uniref:Uncharacterized protein n=1 Tax=Oryza meridionalis TaxID=40149 RepID=A0A0E0DC19_9ORYZ
MRGVHVVMGVRNLSAGARVRDEILKQVPSAKIEILNLDLTSMSSVRRFAENFKALNLPLNILINNAGVCFVPFKLSEDDIELHFATNHIGLFLLTDLLIEKMKVTAIESGKEGRVVMVASGAATVCYVALHPQVAGVTGKYFVDCNVTELKSHALDMDLAKRLWDFSLNLIH